MNSAHADSEIFVVVVVQLHGLLLVVQSQQVNNFTMEEYSYAAALGAARDVTDVATLGGLGVGANRWHGSALAPTTGKLYCAPGNAASVLIINPTTNTTDTTTLGGLGTSPGKWLGVAFAPTTGMLYCAPFNAASVLIINPMMDTTDTAALGGLGPAGGSKWIGIAFAPTTGML